MNLLSEDYDEFIDKLRPYFNEYVPEESIPYLKIQFITTLTPQPKHLEGSVLHSNAYLHAINNEYLLEFGIPGKDNSRFLGSEFLGFTHSYTSISEGIEGLNGIISLSVGYNELKNAIEKILIEAHCPTPDSMKTYEGWKSVDEGDVLELCLHDQSAKGSVKEREKRKRLQNAEEEGLLWKEVGLWASMMIFSIAFLSSLKPTLTPIIPFKPSIPSLIDV
ncbi:hypothetical protein Tco_0324969 [Tanacetum coccineum]